MDHARKKHRLKRGGDHQREAISDELPALPTDPNTLLDLSEAVDRLEEIDASSSELLKLLLFARCVRSRGRSHARHE